jgi:uncharacterized protein (DUF2267 family)
MTKPTAILEARAKAEDEAADVAPPDAEHMRRYTARVLRELIPQIEALGAEGSELEQAVRYIDAQRFPPNSLPARRDETYAQALTRLATNLGWQPSPRPAPAAPAHELLREAVVRAALERDACRGIVPDAVDHALDKACEALRADVLARREGV